MATGGRLMKRALDFKKDYLDMLARLDAGGILLRETSPTGKRHYWVWYENDTYSYADPISAKWLSHHEFIEMSPFLYMGEDRFVISVNGKRALAGELKQRKHTRLIKPSYPMYMRHGRLHVHTPAAASPREQEV